MGEQDKGSVVSMAKDFIGEDVEPNCWDSGEDAQAKSVVDCTVKKEVTGEDDVPAGDLAGGGVGGVGWDIREPAGVHWHIKVMIGEREVFGVGQ